MKRRVLAVAAAAATALAILPAAPAFASAAATANLTSAAAVYPGEQQTFTFSVTNNETNVLGLTGKTIDAISLVFPVNQGFVLQKNSDGSSAAGSATGFNEATPTNLGSSQFVTYRAKGGTGLRPGSTTTINIPVNVKQPLARDLTGAFGIQVSSDNFGTASNATGNLLAKVQVLEILQGGLKALSPDGVKDGSGTGAGFGYSGQDIVYGSTIKNHSRSVLEVTSSLTSSGPDSATPVTVKVDPNGGEAEAKMPVKLGLAESNRNPVFTAAATATNAVAPTKTATFAVQAPVRITPTDINPKHVRTGEGSGRDFTVTASKAGTQAVTALGGSLTFGDNTCALSAPTSTGANNSTPSLTFGCPDLVNTVKKYSEPTANVAGSIVDDNGAAYGYAGGLGKIILDDIAPILDAVVGLPKDRDGDQQVAVKTNGDTITVSGNIQNAGDLAANTVKVTLQPRPAGDPIVFNAPISGSGENRSFSGSATPDWRPSGADSFTTKVEAVDAAGNPGAVDAPAVLIDKAGPVLQNLGLIVDSTTIEVKFNDITMIAGGCDPSFWRIDGQPDSVTAVKASGDCTQRDSGVRTLTLRTPLGPDDTPQVTYDPGQARTTQDLLGNRRPAKDGAGIDGLQKTIDTITDIVPQAPGIVKLERRDGASDAAFEPATFDADEKRYYTNVDGKDALRLTINNVRANYTVEVVSGGQVVGERKFGSNPDPLAGNSSFEGDVTVRMPEGETPHEFKVRLLSTQAKYSDPATFTVVLDKVVPGLGAPQWDTNSQTATVRFSEKIVAGSDFSDNWLACEKEDLEEGGTADRCIRPDSVTGSSQLTRTLTVTGFLDPSRFSKVHYFQQSGTRYEDRAGNLLRNSVQPAV